MIEKFEECTTCGAQGKDWNYDGQICALCEKQKEQNQSPLKPLSLTPQPVDLVGLKIEVLRYFTKDRTKSGDASLTLCDSIDYLAARGLIAAKPEPIDYFSYLINKARISAEKAKLKFPQPNYVTLKIVEEAGEVVRGAVHYAENRMEWSEVESEIVQLIAMIIRFVTEGDEVNGIKPPEYILKIVGE